MALVFAPAANAVLGAVRPEEAGQASGATNAIRELGGVLGVAVLASVFTGHGVLRVAAGLLGRDDAARAGRRRGARPSARSLALLIPRRAGRSAAPKPATRPLPEPVAA